MAAQAMYLDLMRTVRARLDTIESLKQRGGDDYTRAAAAAFLGRKVVEGIAFACLVAVDNSFSAVPRKAKNQWNAEKIFKRLEKEGMTVWPSPSVIREPTQDELDEHRVKATIEGIPTHRLTREELIQIYRRLHEWSHEVNPYRNQGHDDFYKTHGNELWNDLSRIDRFVGRHAMSIQGHGFFCVLRDKNDDRTKVISIERPAA